MSALDRLPSDSIYTKLASPVGELVLIASDAGLHALIWERDEADRKALARLRENRDHPVLKSTMRQLQEYFEGRRQEFDVKLAPEGTEFQKRAWEELRRIPYGRTISYAEQAERLGDPKKARAVGMANARNPLAIIVPCHRVIGKSGALTGFGGGIHNKEFLLALERRV